MQIKRCSSVVNMVIKKLVVSALISAVYVYSSDVNLSRQYKQQGGWVGGDLGRVGVLISIRAGRGFWGGICVLVILCWVLGVDLCFGDFCRVLEVLF